MNVVRYEPWGLLRRFQDDVNQLFGESRTGSLGESDQSSVVTSNWTPAVDIKEESDRYVLEADIPGVNPKDIEVTMDNGVLTIKGERKEEKEDKEKHVSERRYGSFQRTFRLPDSVSEDKATAEFKKGVLRVTLPKKPEAQKPVRKIAIKGG